MGFTRNYSDQSNESGFQWEFYCDQCGTAYQTKFVKASSNVMPDLLDAAGSLLGGVFSAADRLSDRAREANWQKEQDAAFNNAINEVRDQFHQCAKCSAWVDTACWDKKGNACRECANTAREEENDAADEADGEMITCPSCEAEVKKAKFCAECGKALLKTCKDCGAQVTGGKFCPECGKKLGR